MQLLRQIVEIWKWGKLW